MRRALAISLMGVALAGCGNDKSDLKAYATEVKARKSSDIEPIPHIAKYEPFTYRPADRRGPFTPFESSRESQQRESSSGIAPERDRRREPLEQFPLDALEMAGTLTVAGTRYALIKSPDGVVHRVTVGDHMGQNYGEIVAVKAGGVRLVEIVPDGRGGYEKRPASIALSE